MDEDIGPDSGIGGGKSASGGLRLAVEVEGFRGGRLSKYPYRCGMGKERGFVAGAAVRIGSSGELCYN